VQLLVTGIMKRKTRVNGITHNVKVIAFIPFKKTHRP